MLGDFNVIISAMPCFLELSEDDVDGRGSSSGTEGRTVSIGRALSSVPSVPCETDDGSPLDSIVGVKVVLGVRNWVLETACLSTVGTLKAGLAARGGELNERGLIGLGNEAAVADRGALSLPIVVSADVSLLMLFWGRERGDGL